MKRKIANWGNYPVVEAEERFFAFPEELPRLIGEAPSFIPRGNGRCYGDASLAAVNISTLKFDKILAFDAEAGLFSCQSGITLDEVLDVIVPRGWFLPVTPGTKFITVGGAVASDIHGKNHHVDGSFSRHVQSMTVVLASGEAVACSREINPDLFEATCGGMGLTGLITEVHFRLKPVETSFIRQKQVKARNLAHLIELFGEYAHYMYSVAWIDCLKKGDAFGRGILILGEHARVSDLTATQAEDPWRLPSKKQIGFPVNLPGWVLNPVTVKAFNALYYAKNTRSVIDSVVSYEPFFYPLDAIGHWNRGYGRAGFVQYQFVLPLSAREGLVEILNRIGDEGLGSFLAVLKVFGPQESLISFPMEGFTLALDFPVRPGLFAFLDELDRIVLDHGGRLYLSKDARMKPDVLERGYARLPEFRRILARYDPAGKMRSLQSDRLRITPK